MFDLGSWVEFGNCHTANPTARQQADDDGVTISLPTPYLWQAPSSTQKTQRKTRPPAIRRSAWIQVPATNTAICELPPVESSFPQGSFSRFSACAIVASARPSSPDHRRTHCFLSRRLSSPKKTAMAMPDVSPVGSSRRLKWPFFSFVEATSRFLGSCEELWLVSLPWN